MSLSPSISSNTLSLSNINNISINILIINYYYYWLIINISTDQSRGASLIYTFNYESLSLLSSSLEKQN